MKNLYYLIKKNFKLLIRSKSSALIIILAPLVMILLIGFSYNTSQTGLSVGVYSSDFTGEVESFISTLQGEKYEVVTYGSTEECIEDIKIGLINTCLSLPNDFKIQDNSQKEITFYIDQTKVNLVHTITDKLNEKFNLKSKEISEGLVTGMISKITGAKDKLDQKSSEVDGVAQKNQNAIAQADSIKAGLDSIDLSVSAGQAPGANESNNTTGSSDPSAVESFRSNAQDSLSEALGYLDDAKSAVSDSELNSSEKSAINDQLSDAETELSSLSDSLGNSENTEFGAVVSLIDDLKNNLKSAENKLTAASNQIVAAGSQLTSMATSLQEGVTSINSIKTTLSEIKNELADQKITDAETISSPLNTKIEKVATEETYLSYLFPALMVLVVMFISILLGTTLVMMEKHNQAFFRNFILPVKKITFVFSTYLTNSLLILVQIAIVLGISLIFLDDVLGKLPLTALVLFVSSSVFTMIGMLIGYVFTSEDTGTLASISMGSFLLFVSGVVLPLENMPLAIKHVASFNPFVISEKIIREIFIFGSSFSMVAEDLFLLVSYAVVLFLIILIVDKMVSKHFLTRMAYKHHKHMREKGPRTKRKWFSFLKFRKKATPS